MYTIMMNPDKHLTKTVITTLYQNENLADKLKFIIPRVYEELNLSDFQCSLVYTLPSGEEKPRNCILEANLIKIIGFADICPLIAK